jgi:hypothetical protein
MTINEAIAHAMKVAEQNDAQAEKIGGQLVGSAIDKYATDCRECAAEHRQLAEWLTELKELRNSIGAVKLKDMKEAVGLLQELNAENDQLTSQLLEAKRLLKLAVEDMNNNNICYDINACNVCAEKYYISCDTFHWRYTDEAEKLLNDEK